MPIDKRSPDSRALPNWPVEWLRIVTPVEAEELSSLSWDSIKRNHPDKIVHLSPRRVGLRAGHALMLAGAAAKPNT